MFYDEEATVIGDLLRDAIRHDRTAMRLEEQAREQRRMAERARNGAEYVRKQRGT